MSLQNLVIVIHIIVSLMLLDDIESNPTGPAIEEKETMEKKIFRQKSFQLMQKLI